MRWKFQGQRKVNFGNDICPNDEFNRSWMFWLRRRCGSVAQRWERWKRAFQIYIDAADITSASKRRSTLLHTGGVGLQEIYYNLPGAHVEESDEFDIYQVALSKLDEYFAPQQSKVYERHIFRLTKQEQGEKFEKFLVRLRHQAAKCSFSNIDDNLIDHIVEKFRGIKEENPGCRRHDYSTYHHIGS